MGPGHGRCRSSRQFRGQTAVHTLCYRIGGDGLAYRPDCFWRQQEKRECEARERHATDEPVREANVFAELLGRWPHAMRTALSSKLGEALYSALLLLPIMVPGD